jgi:hypothetical protein
LKIIFIKKDRFYKVQNKRKEKVGAELLSKLNAKLDKHSNKDATRTEKNNERELIFM